MEVTFDCEAVEDCVNRRLGCGEPLAGVGVGLRCLCTCLSTNLPGARSGLPGGDVVGRSGARSVTSPGVTGLS